MNKVWLISGTSTGLGRLMTERLLERGDRVIATLRRTEALRSLQTRYGDQLHVLPMELTDTAEGCGTILFHLFKRYLEYIGDNQKRQYH